MTLTRRDLGRALAALPAAVVRPSPRSDAVPTNVRPAASWAGVELGIALPGSFGSPDPAGDEAFATCAALGVQIVELHGRSVERLLGAPTAPIFWRPSPEEALESGLLAIEEEMLQDERELAERSFAAQLRTWRSSAPLAPLAQVCAAASRAGIRIGGLKWDNLASISESEVDYAFRAAVALGASWVSTEFSIAGIARLDALAERQRIQLALQGNTTVGPDEYDAAFRRGDRIGAILDIAGWVAGGHGSPVPFLERHAARISHVVLEARPVIDRDGTPFEPCAAALRDVLQQMRDRHWSFPAIVTLADEAAADGAAVRDGGGDQESAITDPLDASDKWRVLECAIAYCRACLSG